MINEKVYYCTAVDFDGVSGEYKIAVLNSKKIRKYLYSNINGLYYIS